MFLAKACFTQLTSGSVVVHRRKPSDINNLNSHVQLALQAIIIISLHIIKANRTMGELPRHVANETRTNSNGKVRFSIFIVHRKLFTALPEKFMSSPAVFVDTETKKDKKSVEAQCVLLESP